MGEAISEQEPPSKREQYEIMNSRLSWFRDNAERYTQNNRVRLFGTEQEYLIVDNELNLKPGSGKELIESASSVWTSEMGSWQLEMVLGPYELDNKALSLLTAETTHHKKALTIMANDGDSHVLGIGLMPKLDLEEIANGKDIFSPNPRYALSAYYFKEKGAGKTTIHTKDHHKFILEDEKAMTLINSIHVNLQATNEKEAMKLFNYSQMLVPVFVALSANSGIINGKELAMRGYQVKMFEEVDFDMERNVPRAGLFPSYITSMEHYFSTALLFAPIYKPSPTEVCEDLGMISFKQAEGSYFPWVRLRTGETPNNHLRIEFRPIAMQPSSEESAALIQFYMMNVLAMTQREDTLLPFDLVKENLRSAMSKGMNATLWWKNGDIITRIPVSQYINYAIEESIEFGIRNNYLQESDIHRFELVKARAQRRISPADVLIRKTKEKNFSTALEEYSDHSMADRAYIHARGKHRI